MNLQDINLKNLSDKIFSDIAEEAAQHITTNTNQNKASQIRKYYDELAMWDEKIHRVSERKTEYDKAAPFIHMLKAKVAYAKGRGHVDGNFVDVFNQIIKQIDSPQTLRNAKLFFEAMLGYRKAYETKNS
ncbi:type III-A CRISPR-associated protein Csm2 [Cardiobacterium hominis]|uniref:type III-A CRISPR-associated protein Csm2 n=1 Tax=Cardiobacterium hominis TaxID=2718 RepID=UPI0028EF03B6|nr:type III-A CRISPR-associated protein Csm2 [Cardiobacterium hominis]